MIEISVYSDLLGLPMIRLSGQAGDCDGARLADEIMLKIRVHTENRHLHPLSLDTACTRAPQTQATRPAVGD